MNHVSVVLLLLILMLYCFFSSRTVRTLHIAIFKFSSLLLTITEADAVFLTMLGLTFERQSFRYQKIDFLN